MDKGQILSESEDNPIVQVLRKTNAVKIDWRNLIIPSTTHLDRLKRVLQYSGTTAENTLVFDVGLNYRRSVKGNEVIYDTGVARGQEADRVEPGSPDADYDIYAAVYSFKPGEEPVEVWRYIPGDSDNNAKQPY